MSHPPEAKSFGSDGHESASGLSHHSRANRKFGLRKKFKVQNTLQTVVIVGTLGLLLVIFVILPRMHPQISLVPNAEPEFSQETGMFEFHIRAQVTGFPRPVVRFGRKDSSMPSGPDMTLIALPRGQEYTLTAWARNRFGGSVAQLHLIAPESIPVPEPPGTKDPDVAVLTIDTILVGSQLIFAGDQTTCQAIMKSTTESDLEFSWLMIAPDGSVVSGSGNPYVWETPSLWGKYIVQVNVSDGQGKEAFKEQSLIVHPVIHFFASPEWSGTVFENRSVVTGEYVFVGDDALNRMAKGFISLHTDLPLPEDFSVYQVEWILPEPVIHGNPQALHRSSMGLWITNADWGQRPITGVDWDAPASAIANVMQYSGTILSRRWQGDDVLAKKIEENLKKGMRDIQFRLQFARESSNEDHRMDGVEYDLSKFSLQVRLVLNMIP